MSELAAICKAWCRATQASEPTWLATVVHVEGSSYRRPGARLLFTADAILAGSVSGGCLERELVRTGPFLAPTHPVLKLFDNRWDDDEAPPGSGCDGKIHLLVEPLSSAADASLRIIRQELQAERRLALATVVRTDTPSVPLGSRVAVAAAGVSTELPEAGPARQLTLSGVAALNTPGFQSTVLARGGILSLVEVIEPPPHLFLFGTGPDALPVARLASLLGWTVTLCGAEGRVTVRDRFYKLAEISERTLLDDVARLERCVRPLALLMSHDYERDRNALASLLRSKAKYIGVLGPTRRTERMLAEIEQVRGEIPAARRAAVFGPAGLALGAETAEEIALSIVAEAQAALAASPTTSLRSRPGAIHASSPPLELAVG